MKWKTAISKADDMGNTIRGYDLNELIGNLTFSEMIYLILKGELPAGNEAKMLDAILVACTEHSIAPPSILSARTAVSSGNPFNVGVAAGILSIGEHHGGAVEQSAKVFQENIGKSADDLVKKMKEDGKRIPGFGHKIYTTDPRTVQLFRLAEQYGIKSTHCRFAEELESALEKASGKKLCINIDGAIAAIMSDMGMDWRLGKGIFTIGRAVGITAHTYEEISREKPYRRLEEEEIEYDGPEKRELPQNFKRKQ